MSLPVTLTFPAAPSPLPAFEIDAWSLEDGLSRLFELTLRALVPDPALPLDRLVGQAIDVTFADQPFYPSCAAWSPGRGSSPPNLRGYREGGAVVRGAQGDLGGSVLGRDDRRAIEVGSRALPTR
jgi:hypothetical protein